MRIACESGLRARSKRFGNPRSACTPLPPHSQVRAVEALRQRLGAELDASARDDDDDTDDGGREERLAHALELVEAAAAQLSA